MKKVKSEIKEIPTPQTSTGNVGYSGKVTVTVQRGKTIVSKQVFKNSGSTELFKFFGYSLAGKYKEAEELRPNKIALFLNTTTDVSTAKKTPMTDNTIRMSNFIPNSGAPILTVNPISGADSCSTTFHFVIPSAYIYSANTQINQICLYKQSESDVNNYLAYFLMTDTDNTAWEPITISGNNFNLIIDWEMQLTNKGGE